MIKILTAIWLQFCFQMSAEKNYEMRTSDFGSKPYTAFD